MLTMMLLNMYQVFSDVIFISQCIFSCILWKTFSWLTLYFYDSIALPKKQHCFGYVQVSPESDFSVVAVSGQPREWRVCDQWPRPLLRSKNDVTESSSRGFSVMPMSVVLKSRYFQIQWRHVRYFLGFIIRRHPTQKKKRIMHHKYSLSN